MTIETLNDALAATGDEAAHDGMQTSAAAEAIAGEQKPGCQDEGLGIWFALR